jgi:Protein of unknown function (DUF1570)
MSVERIVSGGRPEEIDRRSWLRGAVAAGAALGCGGAGGFGPEIAAAEPELSPEKQAEQELERAQSRVKAVTHRPLVSPRSDQYQAVGDATEAFVKLTLNDCDNLAREYLAYYQEHGFDVKRPGRRLTLVVFHDERPYLEFARRFARGVSVYTWGFYSKLENWLVLFDFRNVPLIEKGAGHKNVTTLAHEGTHQLTFNTGLLSRRGDAPRALVEGLALFGETGALRGPAVPGQINGTRLDDLAHIRRREKWISATDLLTDDAAAFGTTLDQTLLAYAEGWVLVYYLMKTPVRLPQLQAYLKTISTRTDKNHRYDDAEKHFGDLERLDQDVRREAIRLQRERQP